MSYLARHRTICAVLQELQDTINSEHAKNPHLTQLVEEAFTYARSMDAKLTEIRHKENTNGKDG